MDRRQRLARTVLALTVAVLGGAIASIATGAAGNGGEDTIESGSPPLQGPAPSTSAPGSLAPTGSAPGSLSPTATPSPTPSASSVPGAVTAPGSGPVGAGEPGGPPPAPLSTAPGSDTEAEQPAGQLAFTGAGPALPTAASVLVGAGALARRRFRRTDEDPAQSAG